MKASVSDGRGAEDRRIQVAWSRDHGLGRMLDAFGISNHSLQSAAFV